MAVGQVRRLRGVALTSGPLGTISGNRRLYREPVVRAAVAEAQVRIAAGRFLCFTSHGKAADDDATHVAGRCTELWCDEAGTARYTVELAGTRAADDVWQLCRGDRSHLAVSIRGAWVGPLMVEDGHDGAGPVEHAPVLTLLGLDTTTSPGIEDATALAVEHARHPELVAESVTVDGARWEPADLPPPPLPTPLSLADQVRAGVTGAAAESEAAWLAQAEQARAGTVVWTPEQQERHALHAALGAWGRGGPR